MRQRHRLTLSEGALYTKAAKEYVREMESKPEFNFRTEEAVNRKAREIVEKGAEVRLIFMCMLTVFAPLTGPVCVACA